VKSCRPLPNIFRPLAPDGSCLTLPQKQDPVPPAPVVTSVLSANFDGAAIAPKPEGPRADFLRESRPQPPAPTAPAPELGSFPPFSPSIAPVVEARTAQEPVVYAGSKRSTATEETECAKGRFPARPQAAASTVGGSSGGGVGLLNAATPFGPPNLSEPTALANPLEVKLAQHLTGEKKDAISPAAIQPQVHLSQPAAVAMTPLPTPSSVKAVLQAHQTPQQKGKWVFSIHPMPDIERKVRHVFSALNAQGSRLDK
jgi:hypothetical protein